MIISNIEMISLESKKMYTGMRLGITVSEISEVFTMNFHYAKLVGFLCELLLVPQNYGNFSLPHL